MNKLVLFITALCFILFILFIGEAKNTNTSGKTIFNQKNYTSKEAVNDATFTTVEKATTFIVVRHAEKENDSKDPELSSEGILRAEELNRTLSKVPVNAIYSTSNKRTRQTVQPLAKEKNIAISEYSTQKPYEQLINEISEANRGKTVVIVGHSNTVPDLLKALSSNSFSITINDNQYDNLFIVSRSEELKPVVLHLKYGKASL